MQSKGDRNVSGNRRRIGNNLKRLLWRRFFRELMDEEGEPLFMETRHGELLSRARKSMQDAGELWKKIIPLISSVSISGRQQCLGNLLGKIQPKITGQYISEICIGK